MSTRLVILGLLHWQPFYGYELKQEIERKMGDWTSIAFGSIYFALDKMQQEGLIEKAGIQQDEDRPARTIYRITQGGRDEFMRLLRENWKEVEHTYFNFDIGLFFLNMLPHDEAAGYLRQRLENLAESIRHLEEHRSYMLSDPHIPPVAGAIVDHTLEHYQAEINWTQKVLQMVEEGKI